VTPTATPTLVPGTVGALNSSPTLLGGPTFLTSTATINTPVYAWRFGDGTFGSGGALSHVYPAIGNYTAVVTASNGIVTLTTSTLVSILDVPITGLASVNNSPTWNGRPTVLTATASAGSNIGYQWNFSGSLSAGSVVSHAYALPGTYTYIVTATNTRGSVTATGSITVVQARFLAPGGVDGGDCRAPASPCASFAYALVQAAAGDYVGPAAGTYIQPNVIVTRNVIIQGAGAGSTFVQSAAAPTLSNLRVFRILSGTVATLRGMTIRYGAGIRNDGVLQLEDSAIISNTATLDGGGIYNIGRLGVRNSSVLSNTANRGGGVYNAGVMTVTDSAISSNRAVDSAGLHNAGVLTLTRALIANNVAVDSGGGLYNTFGARLAVRSSALVSNSASAGGGLANAVGGLADIGNSTIAANVAVNSAGINNNGALTLSNSTLAGNAASNKGGGIYNSAAAAFRVRHTILAGNTAATDVNCSGLGSIDTLGFNLQYPGAGCAGLTAGDPKLGPLASNGNTLPMMALLGGSFAVDEGDPAGCADSAGAAVLVDQRGTARPQGPRCDIGAYEHVPSAITGLTASVATPARFGTAAVFTASISGDDRALYTWSFGDGGVTLSTHSPVISKTYAQLGAYTARVTATNGISMATASAALSIIDTPIITVAASSTSPTRFGEVTTFSASAGGSHLIFTWNFGDAGAAPAQRTGTGTVVTHTYTAGGLFTAQITATNGVSAVVTSLPMTITNQVYVNATATGANNGRTWADAYNDLQPALTSVISGQELWVAAGEYYAMPPGGNRLVSFQLRNGVALYGGFGGGETDRSQRNASVHPTVLHGQPDKTILPSEHVVNGSGVDASAVLDGFRVTDGYALSSGGGLFIVGGSPTIRNTRFDGNFAHSGYGGAIYIQNGSPRLSYLMLENNYAYARGGAIYNDASSHPIIEYSTFIYNLSQYGGAIFNETSVTLYQLTFSRNHASYDGGALYNGSGASMDWLAFLDNTAGDKGAGMYSLSGSSTLSNASFVRNTVSAASGLGGGLYVAAGALKLPNASFSGNTAFDGGGLYVAAGAATLTNVDFTGNSASHAAGALWANASVTLTRVSFVANSAANYGGAVRNAGYMTFTNAIFAANSAALVGGAVIDYGAVTFNNASFGGNRAAGLGGALYVATGSAAVRNSVLYGNVSGSGPQVRDAGGPVTIADSLVEGGWVGGTNIINLNPGFQRDPTTNGSADGGNMRLQPSSPARNAGNNATCAPDDRDGVARPRTGGNPCDMGAYEYTGLLLNAPGNQPQTDAPGVGVFAAPPGDVLVQAPQGAVTATTELAFTAGLDAGLRVPEAYRQVNVFALDAWQAHNRVVGFRFVAPVTLVIGYERADLSDDEAQALIVRAYDPATGEWTSDGIEAISRDADARTVTVATTRTGAFGLFFAPLMLNARISASGPTGTRNLSAGAQVTYRVVVDNPTDQPVTDATLSVALPTGMVFEGWETQGGAAQANGAVNLGALALGPHDSVVIAFSARTGNDPALAGTTLPAVLTLNANGLATFTERAEVSLNGPVSAVADTITTTLGGTVAVNVLANDLNPDASPLALVAVGAPAHGTAEIVGHAIVYTPHAGASGADVFTYTVQDGTFSAEGTVTVWVTARTLYLPVVGR
jgi:uncharacterized repeat protein (TIGR01451 family)